jgi:diguanylate cyclase (GGDEF)-like protein/PAS domain S-box-containing protein
MRSPRSPRPSFGRAVADGARGLPEDLEVRTLLDQLPAILYVSEVGVAGRWHYVSAGVRAILGFSPEEWMRDPGLWARQMHPADRDRVFAREDQLLQPTVPDEYRMRHRDGAMVWVRDEAALVTDAQGCVRWHGVMSDITDRKLAEAELERRAEQQAAVARLGEHALEGADVAELINEALQEAARILDVEMGAVLEQSDEHPADLTNGVIGQIEGRDGRWGILWLPLEAERHLGAADIDFVQALANILADAIQRRASEDDIRYQAVHDPLTSLPNRVLFLDRLGQALGRPGAQVAVVLLDIDNFKLVNDSLGHGAGDELLMKIAPRLDTALRPGDTIARLGGDEFLVLLERVPDERAAARVAERIVSAFEAPFQLSAGEHFAKASLGIAMSNGEDSLPAGLIRDADAAMYQAKARGRGRFEIFDRAMRARTVERLSVENDLRRALERDELRVSYQPIVSLRDGSVASVEALLRWEHPKRGVVLPAEFISVAEESGLIEPIGRWVLEAACTQAALWHALRPDSRPLGISVNLSVRQFTQRDLEATVAQTLDATGIEPSSLCLEITESVLLEEPEGVSDTLRRLARLGVRFVLDDFGTGYSSLAHLQKFPVDALKIDRSFISGLKSSEEGEMLIRTLVQLGKALAIETFAEGIEEQDELAVLREEDCDSGQGFLFARPMDASATQSFFESRSEGADQQPGALRRAAS